MSDSQRRLGARLRAIRRQQDLTLHDVEERSGGRWKAVVVGSYERGDRAISITKLAALAEFYGVPLHDLLPVEEPETDGAPTTEQEPPVCLDLTELSHPLSDDALMAVARYTRRIQVERGDYNGRILTIRHSDLRAISLALGRDVPDLLSDLDRANALVH